MCGGVAHSFCMAVKWLSASKKRYQNCLMSSAQSFYGICLRSVVHSLAVFLGMCHSSTSQGTPLHMTQFYQAFPSINILQAANAKGKRPGYEATKTDHVSLLDTVSANSMLSSVTTGLGILFETLKALIWVHSSLWETMVSWF